MATPAELRRTERSRMRERGLTEKQIEQICDRRDAPLSRDFGLSWTVLDDGIVKLVQRGNEFILASNGRVIAL